jgi:hypothetical protein
MKRILVVATAALLFPSVAFAIDHRKDTEPDEFILASGEIKCVHGATDTITGIYCLRTSPVYSICLLDGKTEGQEAESDQPFMDNPPVMAFGETRVYKDMTCVNSKKGLFCKSNGKGFRLSPTDVQIFK